jgi:hypothetical protein
MARPHGTKNIETPEKMWEYFEAYVKHVKNTPRKKMVFVGKDCNKDFELLERPLTLEGFELYLCNEGIISDFQQYFENRDNRYTDYVYICSRIKKSIREDQISGGMVGQYNPSITQRLNGLVDQKSVEVKEQPLFGDEK